GAPATGTVAVVPDARTRALALGAALTGAPAVHARAACARARDAIRAACARLPAERHEVVTVHRQGGDALAPAQQDADRASAEDDGGGDGGDADDEGFAFSLGAPPVPGVPDLSVTARPGTFGGTSADAGAQLRVRALADRLMTATPAAGYRRVLDLGCGNGWLL